MPTLYLRWTSALVLGAALLEALGDRKRALKLARTAVRVSPTCFYQAMLAKLAGAHAEAGEARARPWALAPDGLDTNALLGPPAAGDSR